MTGLSRRKAIRAVGIGGFSLAGLSVAEPAGAATPARTAPAPTRSEGSDGTGVALRFTVSGSQIRVVGTRRSVGDQAVITGQLHLADKVEPAGEFFAQTTVVNRRNLLTESTGSMQTHTFVLPNGTLLGSGVVSHQGDGVCAVIGGTADYQGVSGSYTVHQDLEDFDATATYSFSLLSGKAFL